MLGEDRDKIKQEYECNKKVKRLREVRKKADGNLGRKLSEKFVKNKKLLGGSAKRMGKMMKVKE